MSARFRLAVAAVALACAFPRAGHAIVLDWSSVTWTPGSLSNSYDIDSASPGNDITITIGGSTGELTTDPVSGLMSPDISTAHEGGQTPVRPSLNLAMDLGKQDRVITVTITFSNEYALGIEGLSFTIFGIDRPSAAANDYIDQLRSIQGTSITGTSMAPTISGVGSSVSLTGSGLSQVLTATNAVARAGATSSSGNATLSFGPGVRSVSFSFGDDNPAFNNPIPQDISLGSINFSPVPEVNPALGAAVICALAVTVRRWKTRRACRAHTSSAA